MGLRQPTRARSRLRDGPTPVLVGLVPVVKHNVAPEFLSSWFGLAGPSMVAAGRALKINPTGHKSSREA